MSVWDLGVRFGPQATRRRPPLPLKQMKFDAIRCQGIKLELSESRESKRVFRNEGSYCSPPIK